VCWEAPTGWSIVLLNTRLQLREQLILDVLLALKRSWVSTT
jgi:hypothetical protein